MSSKVYFVNLRARTANTNKITKIRTLFDLLVAARVTTAAISTEEMP